ncbi:MAG: sigma factor-like helix-turn-helix DNA-binding protein [Candidatus Fervidibacter sp.]
MLSQLSKRERFVIEQYHFEEQTMQEIAQTLSITHQAVSKIKK